MMRLSAMLLLVLALSTTSIYAEEAKAASQSDADKAAAEKKAEEEKAAKAAEEKKAEEEKEKKAAEEKAAEEKKAEEEKKKKAAEEKAAEEKKAEEEKKKKKAAEEKAAEDKKAEEEKEKKAAEEKAAEKKKAEEKKAAEKKAEEEKAAKAAAAAKAAIPVATVTTTPKPWGVLSSQRLVADTHQQMVNAAKTHKKGAEQTSWGSNMAWLATAGVAGMLTLTVVRGYRRRAARNYQQLTLAMEEGLEAAITAGSDSDGGLE